MKWAWRCWDYVWSPIVFFETRLRGQPCWWSAFAAPVLCAGLYGGASTLFSRAWADAQETIMRSLDLDPGYAVPPGLFALFGALSYPMVLGVAILAVMSINVLYKDVGDPGRLVEFSALCFFTQVPLTGVLVVVAWHFHPEPFQTTSRGLALLAAAEAYRDEQVSGPFLSTVAVMSHCSSVWFATQLTCGLKVAGQLSGRAAVLAGAFLCSVFVGIQVVLEYLIP